MNIVDIRNDRIFVSIAAYRDMDTRNTINDMFAKATHKERIFAGVLTQIDVKNDLHLIIGRRSNVREMVIEHTEAKGCTWARNKILTELRKDEEFVLQIDAHSRFDVGWDVQILEEYRDLPKHDCVLTSYPPAFRPDSPLNTEPKHCFTKFKDWHYSGIPIFMADIQANPEEVKQARPTPGLSAGCLFGPSNIFDRVEYDPYVYFFGEEQSYAIRLYSHGVDLYAPKRTYLYHLYFDIETDKKNLHWNDFDSSKESLKGVERVKFILGLTDAFPHNNSIDIHKYGLGKVRTVAQWEAFSGVSLSTMELSAKALAGNYHDYVTVD